MQREGEKSTPSVVDFLLPSLRMVSRQLLAFRSLVMNFQDKRRRGKEEKWGGLGCEGSFLILSSFLSLFL